LISVVNPEQISAPLRQLKPVIFKPRFNEEFLHLIVPFFKRKELLRILWGVSKGGRAYIYKHLRITGGDFTANVRQIYEGHFKVKTKLLGKCDPRYPPEAYRSNFALD
jgi:hypothetical protein